MKHPFKRFIGNINSPFIPAFIFVKLHHSY
jgi:hypothetical protein